MWRRNICMDLLCSIVLLTGCLPEKKMSLNVTLDWSQAGDGLSSIPTTIETVYIRMKANGGYSGYGFAPEDTPYKISDVFEGDYEVVVEGQNGDEVFWQGSKNVTLTRPERREDGGWDNALTVIMTPQVNFSFSLDDTVPVAGDAIQVSVSNVGFNTNRVVWFVNDIAGGNDEFGTITSAGLYTPPATLPVNPMITLSGHPEGHTDFLATQTFTLVQTSASTILFAARSSGANGLSLWTSDGTPEGTYRVKDLLVSNQDILPSSALNGERFFAGEELQDGRELWRSNATASGTQKIVVAPDSNYFLGAVDGSNPFALSSNGTHVFLSAQMSKDAQFSQYKFIAVDPADDTVTILKDGVADNGNGAENITGVLNGKLFFAHNDYTNGTYSVYSTNGTTVDAPILTSTSSIFAHDFVELGDDLIFVENERKLVKTDGSASGTSVLLNLSTGSIGQTTSNFGATKNMIAFNDAVYFNAGNPVDGYFLWRTDGTASGTAQLIDLDGGAAGNDNPHTFFTLNNHLYFFSDSSNPSVRGLWKTDGTSAGTVRVKELYSGASAAWYEGKSFGKLEVVPGLNRAFFTAGEQQNSHELWVTDGSEEGTKRVQSFGDNESARPSLFIDAGTYLLFSVIDDDGRAKLWKTDGTRANTQLVKDICPDCFDNQTFFPIAN